MKTGSTKKKIDDAPVSERRIRVTTPAGGASEQLARAASFEKFAKRAEKKYRDAGLTADTQETAAEMRQVLLGALEALAAGEETIEGHCHSAALHPIMTLLQHLTTLDAQLLRLLALYHELGAAEKEDQLTSEPHSDGEGGA